ncbi:MAG: nucleoside triphosphate pyrophosphohydrolase [Lentisphaerae bacterium]|nr:nucleoside triphosphate pyrophosphohydrolase [Lentisphaerota bacterium]
MSSPLPERGIDRLLGVVDHLRGEGGCPWDREQTLETLKPYLIEECYEVLDALDEGDPQHHAEELGDVLLQVALHARIRSEEQAFTFDDVAHGIADKLIHRHPHVFGDVKVADTQEVLANWEKLKADEKGGQSILAGIPRHLPALQKAQRLQSRAARVGFDWADIRDVLAKIDEELAETREAMQGADPDHVAEELGDLLFSVVNLARFVNVNAEEALRQTCDKFIRRFKGVEARVTESGRTLQECDLAEMDAHWNAIKVDEKAARPASGE